MNRRAFLHASSAAVAGFGLTACAPRTKPLAVPTRPPLRVTPVDASWDRIIRTTVGLRPHRDAGFVLRADKLDDKLLVHNYGHGGTGMSLSWGTGQMAAELALQQPDRRAAVIGCGAVGLTTARQLQRRGFEVTIYAAAVPPNVTSNMSLAGFTPLSGLVDPEQRTDAWDAQFRRAADISYRQLQLLIGPIYGVSWVDHFTLVNELRSAPASAPSRPNLAEGLDLKELVLKPGEHPFPTTYALWNQTIRIEPSIYLDALVRDVQLWGGRVVIRQFQTTRDLMTLREPVIINCTGLGARELFGDRDLIPLKGQLVVLAPQADVTYQTAGGLRPPPPGSLGLHMMPRSDGIALGGMSLRDVWTLEPDDAERRRVVDGHIELFNAMTRPMRA